MNKIVELTNLITELAHEREPNEDKLNSYKERFNNIYSDGYRHEYSEVTGVLFSIESDEERDFLPEKIKDIKDIMEEGEVKKSVSKLWDHINLENIRLAELKKISKEANKAFTEVNEVKNKYIDLQEKWSNINNQAIEVDEKLKKMDKDIDNSNAKSITILGIFSGIVMAFTGGLSFIASSLQNMNQVSIYRLVLVVILLSMAIFNIIFMLMYMIGKFTGSYIGGKCNCNDRIEGCNDKKIKCAVVRYPLPIWFNILTSLSILTIFIMYIIDRFNLITKVLKYNLYLGLITMAICSIIYFILVYMGLKNIAKIECEYEYIESPLNPINGILSYMQGGYRKKEKYCVSKKSSKD